MSFGDAVVVVVAVCRIGRKSRTHNKTRIYTMKMEKLSRTRWINTIKTNFILYGLISESEIAALDRQHICFMIVWKNVLESNIYKIELDARHWWATHSYMKSQCQFGARVIFSKQWQERRKEKQKWNENPSNADLSDQKLFNSDQRQNIYLSISYSWFADTMTNSNSFFQRTSSFYFIAPSTFQFQTIDWNENGHKHEKQWNGSDLCDSETNDNSTWAKCLNS